MPTRDGQPAACPKPCPLPPAPTPPGPYSSTGALHTGLDVCNGKFDSKLNYAYYATTTYPYLSGCFGPGERVEWWFEVYQGLVDIRLKIPCTILWAALGSFNLVP